MPSHIDAYSLENDINHRVHYSAVWDEYGETLVKIPWTKHSFSEIHISRQFLHSNLPRITFIPRLLKRLYSCVLQAYCSSLVIAAGRRWAITIFYAWHHSHLSWCNHFLVSYYLQADISAWKPTLKCTNYQYFKLDIFANLQYAHETVKTDVIKLHYHIHINWTVVDLHCIKTSVLYYHTEAETKWPPFSRRRFQMHFLNENVGITIRISLKFVPNVSIDNKPTLVQIMALRQTGDKPLSEPMMALFSDVYMRHSASMS